MHTTYFKVKLITKYQNATCRVVSGLSFASARLHDYGKSLRVFRPYIPFTFGPKTLLIQQRKQPRMSKRALKMHKKKSRRRLKKSKRRLKKSRRMLVSVIRFAFQTTKANLLCRLLTLSDIIVVSLDIVNSAC